MTEAEGAAHLKAIFEAEGYRIAERFALDEDGVFVELDGWDATARVGYEYITSEAGDRLEFTPGAIAALEARMARRELFVFLVDEHDVDGEAALSSAAREFLARVASLRATA
ncbi:MAG: hypothetical protein IT374_21350 [Polyangiaceae bacterium]|nr:hypothetical protein [Polyangiaceae bacterium]